MAREHSSRNRGLDSVVQSSREEGRFGYMFRRLPSFHHSDELLERLAAEMRQEETETSDNSAIPAGYTYLGQFLDHDITFDPTSELDRLNDPAALTNFRNPRFDLDSLYGSGPADEPFQYDKNEGDIKLLLGKGKHTENGQDTEEDDLPRNSQGRALIGDPRNDENIIVSQLQLAFLKLHNKFVDQVREEGSFDNKDDVFKEAQKRTRWHYQWVVVHDFLARTVGEDTLNIVLSEPRPGISRDVKRRFYLPRVNAYMPVEFSVAAYRFGHSQVRPLYLINNAVPELPIFSQSANPAPLEDFSGGRHLPQSWTVDWSFFFDTNGPNTAKQKSQLMDTKLAAGLFNLPGLGGESLALRNMKRARALGLASGRDVAKAMGLSDTEILTEDELGFKDPAPLWFYVLREAQIRRSGATLGPVGGRMVAEVFLGLLELDKLSYINVEPAWTPSLPDADGDGRFTMSDLLRFAVPDQIGPADQSPGSGWS